jgi:(p)ppGpp synthase/HD superfamily hydrolase
LEDSTCYLRAHELAAQIHEGQTDKAGRPYIERCERVARNLMRRWPEASKDEIQAALLHDVIEDGTDPALIETASQLGISDRAMEIVRRLTRDGSLSYFDWIEQIARSGDEGAIRVKLADLEDNSDPAREHSDRDRMVRRNTGQRQFCWTRLNNLAALDVTRSLFRISD